MQIEKIQRIKLTLTEEEKLQLEKARDIVSGIVRTMEEKDRVQIIYDNYQVEAMYNCEGRNVVDTEELLEILSKAINIEVQE